MNKLHATIAVDSRGRNEGLSQSNTDFLYQLTQPINFHKRNENKQYFIRIENVRIPVAFYNLNSNYDTFSWITSTTGAVSVSIDHGNYTIDELISELETLMNAQDTNTYTITYNEISQKVSIASTGTENITSFSGNGWQLIGIESTQSITGASTLEANNVAYTNTTSTLKLVISNLVSNNVYSNTITPGQFKQTNLQNVSVIIPVKEIRNEFVFFNNHNGPMIKLPNLTSIKNLNIKLLDSYNNSVQLNGLFFSFDISIYEYNKNLLFPNK